MEPSLVFVAAADRAGVVGGDASASFLLPRADAFKAVRFGDDDGLVHCRILVDASSDAVLAMVR